MSVRESTRGFGQRSKMATVVRLLDVDPDLVRFIAEDDRQVAQQVVMPVRQLPKGPVDVPTLLTRAGAFAAIVLDGIILDRLQLGDQAALRLLGPGDVVSLSGPSPRC
jgi:hypothetical protein